MVTLVLMVLVMTAGGRKVERRVSQSLRREYLFAKFSQTEQPSARA
jgi:hypothetical protein